MKKNKKILVNNQIPQNNNLKKDKILKKKLNNKILKNIIIDLSITFFQKIKNNLDYFKIGMFKKITNSNVKMITKKEGTDLNFFLNFNGYNPNYKIQYLL